MTDSRFRELLKNLRRRHTEYFLTSITIMFILLFSTDSEVPLPVRMWMNVSLTFFRRYSLNMTKIPHSAVI